MTAVAEAYRATRQDEEQANRVAQLAATLPRRGLDRYLLRIDIVHRMSRPIALVSTRAGGACTNVCSPWWRRGLHAGCGSPPGCSQGQRRLDLDSVARPGSRLGDPSLVCSARRANVFSGRSGAGSRSSKAHSCIRSRS
jgi:hypothetical protein